MEKSANIRQLLGLKQEEMAMLLHISRAQWSMYESGSRSLPTTAMTLLAEMLFHTQSNDSLKKEKANINDAAVARHRQRIKNRIDENWLQLYRLDQKLSALQRKQEAAVRRAYLYEFLKDKHSNATSANLHVSGSKLSNENRVNHTIAIEDFEFERDNLLREKQWLEAKLKSIDND